MNEKTPLTKEQILQIPDLLKNKTQKELGIFFDVNEKTIRNWVRKLRQSGYKVEKRKGKIPLLEIK